MASGGRIKCIARRVDDWVSQTAASASRHLNVPSPVSFPDDECEEERETADSNETPDDDASGRRSPEFGTGGFNENDTISDQDEEQIEEQEDEIVQQQEEEGDCSDDEDKSEVSLELEIAGGGYHGLKSSRNKYSSKRSPSSVSNASTGSCKRLNWEFLKSIDLRQGRVLYEEEIENAMKMQMSICGKHKMVTCSGDRIQGKQTLAGWKLRRVFCFDGFSVCMLYANFYRFTTDALFEKRGYTHVYLLLSVQLYVRLSCEDQA